MKKFFTLIMLMLITAHIYSQIQVKVTLDTKKFVNIDCSLGADCAGGPSTLSKVYMHSGLCTTGDIYCKTQIIPLHSLVWEHVVGNWGNNPQDDGVGEMVSEGNGIFTKTIILEDYFSGPWVSTEWNETQTVQSTPMPQGATPYTMGLVFRNFDGTITGRDNMCNDIFVTDLNTTNPQVIQSFDLLPWPNSPVTIERNIIGIADVDKINFFNIAPNPVKDNIHIEFYIKKSAYTTIYISDNLGRVLTTLIDKEIPNGKHVFKTNVNELNLCSGIYYITISNNNNSTTQKLIIAQ